jgi:uncharacterized Zn finger protein
MHQPEDQGQPMNSYQLQELIKNIQAMMRCPSCGSSYNENHIHFLGQLDMAALIQLDCQSCGLPVMATIVVSDKQQPATAAKVMSDVSTEELRENDREPVSADHVVDTHQFLKDFDGNFEKLFK